MINIERPNSRPDRKLGVRTFAAAALTGALVAPTVAQAEQRQVAPVVQPSPKSAELPFPFKIDITVLNRHDRELKTQVYGSWLNSNNMTETYYDGFTGQPEQTHKFRFNGPGTGILMQQWHDTDATMRYWDHPYTLRVCTVNPDGECGSLDFRTDPQFTPLKITDKPAEATIFQLLGINNIQGKKSA